MDIFTKLADWMVFDILKLSPNSAWGGGLHFFVEDTAKIFVLLAVMIYLIGLVRAGLPVEKIRNFLVGRNRYLGYVLAAVLGAITPFCSCSSIPLFLGFTAAGIPIGITMAFLITSPMVNEAAVVMLGGLVGWDLTAVYVGFGMAAGIFGGMFFDAIGAGRWLTMPSAESKCCCGSEKTLSASVPSSYTWRYRHSFAWTEVCDILRSICLWVVAGVALGAFLHNFVPKGFIEHYLGTGQWWSVPAAVAVGIPTYANATAVIPAIAALIEKGLPVGTAFAFMMSAAAASLPEFIMLKKVMHTKLLLVFAAYLLVFFTLCGWLLNWIYNK